MEKSRNAGILSVYGTVYSTVLHGGVGGPTVHGTMALGRPDTIHGAVAGLMLDVHGTVSLVRSPTMQDPVGGGVLLMLPMHRIVKETRVIIHIHERVHRQLGQ